MLCSTLRTNPPSMGSVFQGQTPRGKGLRLDFEGEERANRIRIVLIAAVDTAIVAIVKPRIVAVIL